jgi:hypothetical protein
MKKPKQFIIDLYNRLFEKPKEEVNSRRLEQDPKTGKLNWSEGEKPFEDEDLNSKVIEPTFHFEDNEKKGTRTVAFKVPTAHMIEPLMKNRFHVKFPGIPGYYFNSYKYLGTDIHSQQLLTSKRGVIKDDYSVLKVMLSAGGEIDICDKLVSLEDNPKIGDVNIELLDPTGVILKTILIRDCEVTEIKVFRDLDYGNCGDKSNDILYGEIVFKHKQRKLI